MSLYLAETPEALYTAIMEEAEAIRSDTVEMNATAFLDGRVWVIAAEVLETAAAEFRSRVIRAGYPWRG